MAEAVEHRSHTRYIVGSNQTNDIKLYLSLLSWLLGIITIRKGLVVSVSGNVTEWDVRS